MSIDLSFLIIAGVVVLFFLILFTFIPVGLWIAAISAGVRVSLISLVAMRLRRVPPARIINPLIKAEKAGLDVEQNQLEAHFLAGGNVDRVVDALIAADKARIALPFDRAAGIDLISTARVTVRANLERLVGGAGEETIIARVGEGIVSSIGSSDSHKRVLENPDSISKTVLQKGLDSGTAFEILSIDIADVNVGRNIGAQLQTDQAEADKRVAQAKAEERRAMAVAAEQENRARVEEMRAKVVEAEAEVPLAMAEAFRKGHMGVMDYYQLRNIESDTDMRQGIANASSGGEEDEEIQ